MKLRKHLSNYQIFAIGFAVLILVGGILLSMPFSATDGKSTPFINSLFHINLCSMRNGTYNL